MWWLILRMWRRKSLFIAADFSPSPLELWLLKRVPQNRSAVNRGQLPLSFGGKVVFATLAKHEFGAMLHSKPSPRALGFVYCKVTSTKHITIEIKRTCKSKKYQLLLFAHAQHAKHRQTLVSVIYKLKHITPTLSFVFSTDIFVRSWSGSSSE